MADKLEYIMEGFNPDLTPTGIYVVQGDRAFFLTGNQDSLVESIGDKIQVVESIDKLDLMESSAPGMGGEKTLVVRDGQMFLEGPFSQYDFKNINGRVYKRDFWEQHLAENSYLRKMEKGRQLLGLNEHPADGRTKISEVSLVTTLLKLIDESKDKTKPIIGRAEICNQLPAGKILEGASYHNLKFGVSSRAKGVVNPDGTVDKDKTKIVAWDAVSSPSVPIAYPKMVEGNKTAKTNESADPECEDCNKKTVVAVPATPEFTEAASLLESAEQIAVKPVVGTCEELSDLHVEVLESIIAIDEKEVPATLKNRSDNARKALLTRLGDIFQNLMAQKPAAVPESSQTVNESELEELPEDEGINTVLEAYNEEITRLTEEVEDLTNQLVAAQGGKKIAEARANVLIESSVDKSEDHSETPIQREVRHLLENDSSLAKHKSSLLEADTVEEVRKAANLFKAQDVPVPVSVRKSLPRVPFGPSSSGSNVIESISDENQRPPVIIGNINESVPGIGALRRNAAKKQRV